MEKDNALLFNSVGKMTGVFINPGTCEDEVDLHIDPNYELIQDGDRVFFRRKVSQVPDLSRFPDNIDNCSGYIPTMGRSLELPRSYVDSIEALIRLIIARDTYWRIYGDWKPKDSDNKELYYTIRAFGEKGDKREILRGSTIHPYVCLLIFPTSELRDRFLQSFKEDIKKAINFI